MITNDLLIPKLCAALFTWSQFAEEAWHIGAGARRIQWTSLLPLSEMTLTAIHWHIRWLQRDGQSLKTPCLSTSPLLSIQINLLLGYIESPFNACYNMSRALSRSPILEIKAPTAALLANPMSTSSLMWVDCFITSDNFARDPDIAKAAAIPSRISCFSCPSDIACKTRAWKRSDVLSRACNLVDEML